MRFKSKFGETMLWLGSAKIIKFKNGYADVDAKDGAEMRKMGYIEDSTTKTSSNKKQEKPIEEIVESPVETVVEDVKPIKPIRPVQSNDVQDSEINSEI